MVLLTTVIALLGFIILAWGIMKYKSKKTDVGGFASVLGVVLLVVAFAGAGGQLAALSGVPVTIDTGVTDDAVAPIGADAKPYTTLTLGTQIWGSNSYTGASGTLRVFEAGVDPRMSNANAYDTITIASGVGNTTAGKLKSATDYVIVYDGSTTYYDQWYNGNVFPSTSQLPYVQTTESAISTANIDVRNILTIATISDPLAEAATSGIINSQTDVNGSVASSGELQVGADATPADDDTIWYNKTNGDGQFYMDITIAFDGANKKVKNPVMDIVNDLSTPFDGNEFSAVTMIRQSGTDYGIPRDVTENFNKALPISLGAEAEGGDSGIYRLTFNADESTMDAAGDKLYIYVDDNGRHLGQDILKGTKATASDAITIGVRA